MDIFVIIQQKDYACNPNISKNVCKCPFNSLGTKMHVSVTSPGINLAYKATKLNGFLCMLAAAVGDIV